MNPRLPKASRGRPVTIRTHAHVPAWTDAVLGTETGRQVRYRRHPVESGPDRYPRKDRGHVSDRRCCDLRPCAPARPRRRQSRRRVHPDHSDHRGSVLPGPAPGRRGLRLELAHPASPVTTRRTGAGPRHRGEGPVLSLQLCRSWYTGEVRDPRAAPEGGAGALQPVARATTASDLVADSIRAAILSGQLKPGETLVERRLAVQLGVSKTPVREALIALSTSGLVAVNPNRGVTVRRLTLDDIRKCYEVRLLLEPWAV